MLYVVVTAADKKAGKFHCVAVQSDTFNVIDDYGFVTSEAIVNVISSSGGQIVPLNFSIGPNRQIVQNCGDFSRFSQRGSAVVLAEIKSKGGRVLGYRLLSCANNACVNLRLEEILQREKSMGENEHFLQNGIIRKNTVNCYPMKPFPVITVEGTKKSAPKQAGAASGAAGGTPTPAGPAQRPKQRPAGKRKYTAADFSEKQLSEMSACKKAGVSPDLIKNPDLSQQQMRILWVSKSKGCMAEAFADPRYTPDQMKFYADRLYDKQTVADCKEMLEHPELSPEEMSELYACVCDGVPYSEYIGMSATDISVKREMATAKYWGSSSVFKDDDDPDYVHKALGAAIRIKSGT